MVSVCMAVKNGESYIGEQIDSILRQLSPGDELIVSDDHSSDSTIEIVERYGDRRIKIYSSTRHGSTHNFELALSRSAGDFIFLADQDDVWHPKKIGTMLPYLEEFDLAVCDCALVDERLEMISPSFFELNKSGRGFLKNLISNSYMGCCMGFRRGVIKKALPFPGDTVIHDFWIGMVAETHFKTFFLQEPLVMHRIHTSNASTSGRSSIIPPMKRVSQRYQLVRNLISRSL